MSMAGVLNEVQWRGLDGSIEAFEEQYAREGHADIRRFLPEPSHPSYLAVLCELVRVELEHSWQSGRSKRLQDYEAAFPELFQHPQSLREVAFEEYRLRRQAGESPCLEEYSSRFGIDVHNWQSGAGGPQSARGRNGWRSASARQKQVRSPAESGIVAELPTLGTTFGDFRLIRELGRGAFGRVYLAQQGELAGRLVVLKVSTDIWSESQTLSQLQHTNIVPIYSILREGPLQAVCMPYYGSTTLADLLREMKSRSAVSDSAKGLLSTLDDRRRQIAGTVRATPDDGPVTPGSDAPRGQSTPPTMPRGARSSSIIEKLEGLSYVEVVVWIAGRLADGLAHAHERGILHRDLKPANVLVTDEGQPMLLDFNLSADTKLRSSSEAALVGGTLPYMALEHINALQGGDQPVDARSDLFSLGVMLFELLAGRQPFAVHSGPLEIVLPRMIADRLAGPPRIRCSNPAVSPAVEAIVRRCLEPDPGRRYQTARQLQEDLQRQLDHLPLRYTPEPSIRERARKWLRRHPRISSSTAVAAAASVLITVLAALFALRGHRLATLEASENFNRFRQEGRGIQFSLNIPEPDRKQLEEGIMASRRVLSRYQVLENPAWAQSPAVRQLAAPDQRRLREDIGELLLLLARATARSATGSVGPARDSAIQASLRLSSLAESCYSPNEVPRAVWTQRAALLQLAGQDDQSQSCEQKARAVPLRTARDHYLSASELVGQWRFGEAMPLLQEACRQDPQNPAMWLVLGNAHAGLSQFSDAVASYSASSALCPNTHWPHYNRGLAHLDEKDYARACASFDKALEVQTDHPESYINRGIARMGMGNNTGAIEDFTRALDLGAPYTRVYLMRGRAREKTGDRDGANRDREEGLRREPTDEQSWIARGIARLASDAAGALADFQKALALNPRSRAALENKAHVLSERLGRADEAVAALDQALALYPDYVLGRAGRGVLLARAGKRDAALRDAEVALARANDAGTQYQVAGIYALTSRQVPEDRQQALRLLASALRQEAGWLKVVPQDTDLDAIRDLPELHRLMEAVGTLEAAGKNKGVER